MKALNPLSAFVCGLRADAVFMTCKLPLLAVISSAGLAAHAQSTVKISGAIDGGLAYVKTDRFSQFQTASGSIAASNLTLQGKEDLGGGYNASFLLRALYTTSTGASSGGRLFGSEAKMGLEGPLGRVELGRLFSPTHQSLVFRAPSQSNFAGAFNLAIGGYSPYWDNSVRYTSPTVGGLNMLVQHSTSILDTEAAPPNEKNGRGSAGAINFVKGAVDVSGVLERVTSKKFPVTDYAVNRGTLMGTYNFGPFKAHAGYVSEKYAGKGAPLEFNLTILGASVPVSPVIKISIEAGHKRFLNSPSRTDFIGLGAFYNLSKRTILYSEIADIRNKGASKQSVYRGIPVLAGENTSAYMIGLRHSF